MARSLKLVVQSASRTTLQPSRAEVRRWIGRALLGPAELTVRIVDRREGHLLNQAFRGRDYPTNVLTFVYGEENGILRGDMVLCAPVIKQEAKRQRKPVDHHYAHLIIHGILHLQGHDHEEPAQAQVMESLETRLLAQLDIPNPYAPPHE